MAELAYAHDSGSCPGNWVWVQVPSSALKIFLNTKKLHLKGEVFSIIYVLREEYAINKA